MVKDKFFRDAAHTYKAFLAINFKSITAKSSGLSFISFIPEYITVVGHHDKISPLYLQLSKLLIKTGST